MLASSGETETKSGGRGRMRTTSARRALVVCLLAVLSASCGNRLPHEEIVARAQERLRGAAAGGPAAALGAPAASVDSGGDAAGEGTAGALAGAAQAPGSGSAPSAGGSGAVAPQPGGGSSARPASSTSAASGADRGQPAGAVPGRPTPGGPKGAAPAAPVVIGHVGTYSGVLGAIFSGGREMAQVWARSVNARGGLNGHPVKLITADDGADPARNAAIVRDMVENQGAIAFVGNIVPLSISGSLRYLESKGIPVVGGEGAIRTWWESPVLFPHTGYVESAIAGGAFVAIRGGHKRIGVLYCAEAAACADGKKVLVEKGGVTRAGGQVVYQAQISLAQPDFTAECVSARNATVEAVLVLADGNTVSRVARSCSQQGYKPQLVSFGLALVNDLQNDPNLDGLVGTNLMFPWMLSDTPATAEYARAIQTYAPKLASSGATATVWSAGKLMEVATRNAPADLTSKAVMEGLWALREETLGGLTPPLTYARGQPSPKSPCYWQIRLANKRWTAPDGMKLLCPPETAPT